MTACLCEEPEVLAEEPLGEPTCAEPVIVERHFGTLTFTLPKVDENYQALMLEAIERLRDALDSGLDELSWRHEYLNAWRYLGPAMPMPTCHPVRIAAVRP